MKHDESPTARALLALELIQNSPGVTADHLASRLDVSERAARRYVGILREAGIPIESVRGPHGGYHVGRGLRLPPLMFTTTEALGLVMAVLDSAAVAETDPVGSALGKILRVLPASAAAPAEAVWKVSARNRDPGAASPDPSITAALVQACDAGRRLQLRYRGGREMTVDPWAVVVRRGRWYLLCWSHTRDARRVLRVDRIAAVHQQGDTFTPPADLDPVATLEEHLAEGWAHEVEVIIDAPEHEVARWMPRNLGRREPIDADHTRLIATTDEPDWYARQLTAIAAPFRIVRPRELIDAVETLSRRLMRAGRTVIEDVRDG